MSWSVSASGHADSKEDEAKVIEAMRTAVQADDVKATSAQMWTQYHGQVHLLQPNNGDQPTAVL